MGGRPYRTSVNAMGVSSRAQRRISAVEALSFPSEILRCAQDDTTRMFNCGWDHAVEGHMRDVLRLRRLRGWLRRAPVDRQAELERGLDALAAGRHAEALDALDAALADEPDNPVALVA